MYMRGFFIFLVNIFVCLFFRLVIPVFLRVACVVMRALAKVSSLFFIFCVHNVTTTKGDSLSSVLWPYVAG